MQDDFIYGMMTRRFSLFQPKAKELFLNEHLNPTLTKLEALLMKNKNGDGFFVGDTVRKLSLKSFWLLSKRVNMICAEM